MSDVADKFKEQLAKVTDEGLRATLLANFNEVNQVKGEYGQKLIKKDEELAELNKEKQTYSKSFDILKKLQIKPEDIPGVLEKLGVQKTIEEEYALTKAALQEKIKSEGALEKQVKKFQAEKAIKGLFEKERAEFKDASGKSVVVKDRFVNLDKLYDVEDLTNETVLKEKCKQVLTEAVTAQTEVMRDLGFQGKQVHSLPDGTQNAQTDITDLKTIGEINKNHGAEAAIAADRARRGVAKK